MILKAGREVFILRELPAWMDEVLEDDGVKKVIYNAQFDLTWAIDASLKRGGLLASARSIADPMLKSQLSHRYRTRSGAQKAGRPEAWVPNDLASVLKERRGVTIEKAIDHDVTDWTGPWSPEMVDYMLEDIDDLIPLNAELDKEMRRQGQERAAWIEEQVVFGTAWMTYNGIQPDVPAWGCALAEPPWHLPNTEEFPERAGHPGPCVGAIADWRERYWELTAELKALLPGVENFASVPQLMRALPEALGGPLVNTKKATLKQLAPEFPVIDRLLDQRHFQTRLKNWGPHYLDAYVCRVCGRFHPNWRQIGTETSRFSCSRPNLQQIPRAQEFRSLFVAPPGFLIASLDYSAIEVVAAAVFAGCPNLLAACATGDPHLATAKMVSGDDTITKKDPRRQNAKIANFGLLFGGGADGLVKQARDLFDVELSRGQAQVIMADYYRLYPELRGTKNQAYRAMDSQDDAIEVRNAAGFRRILEGFNRKPTSWLNSRIQSDAGYGLKSSFPYLRDAGLLPFLLAQVHDELLFEFPEEDAQELSEQAQACMIRGMRDVLGARVPVTVDIALAKVWT